MTEKPILFSGAMVRAILEDRKTMTRRVVKVSEVHRSPFKISPIDDEFLVEGWPKQDRSFGNFGRAGRIQCPYGKPGDRLWARETFRETGSAMMDDGKLSAALAPGNILYRADGHEYDGPWRPSIHMPRWASRITLEITGVRVERLHCITESDAKAEGLPLPEQDGNAGGMSAGRHFEYLWEDINGKRPGCAWADNPYVWVVEFRRIT